MVHRVDGTNSVDIFSNFLELFTITLTVIRTLILTLTLNLTKIRIYTLLTNVFCMLCVVFFPFSHIRIL